MCNVLYLFNFFLLSNWFIKLVRKKTRQFGYLFLLLLGDRDFDLSFLSLSDFEDLSLDGVSLSSFTSSFSGFLFSFSTSTSAPATPLNKIEFPFYNNRMCTSWSIINYGQIENQNCIIITNLRFFTFLFFFHFHFLLTFLLLTHIFFWRRRFGLWPGGSQFRRFGGTLVTMWFLGAPLVGRLRSSADKDKLVNLESGLFQKRRRQRWETGIFLDPPPPLK